MKIHVELFPLLVRGLTQGKSERLVLEETLGDKATLGHLVDQLVAKRPALAEVVLDPGTKRPRNEITVSVNEQLLPLLGALDTELHDGDRVFLLMAMPGG